MAFDAEPMPGIGEVLHQMVVDSGSGPVSSDDEVSVPRIPPRDRALDARS